MDGLVPLKTVFSGLSLVRHKKDLCGPTAHEIQNLRFKIRNSKSEIQNLRFKISHLLQHNFNANSLTQ